MLQPPSVPHRAAGASFRHLAVLLLLLIVALVAVGLGAEFGPTLYSAEGFLRTALLIHAWTPSVLPVEWNGPSWSLSAEWFAYLLYSYLAQAGLRRQARPSLLLLVAIA